MICQVIKHTGTGECADNWRGVNYIPYKHEIKIKRIKAELIETLQDKMVNVINYFE